MDCDFERRLLQTLSFSPQRKTRRKLSYDRSIPIRSIKSNQLREFDFKSLSSLSKKENRIIPIERPFNQLVQGKVLQFSRRQTQGHLHDPCISSYYPRRSSRPKKEVIKSPYKILDAPDLQDDFYLNLIDWGNNNLLAVGLGPSLYLWNPSSSKVTHLVTLDSDLITSVSWSHNNVLAFGTNNGLIHLWDAQGARAIQMAQKHENRIASLAWNQNLLSSGSRDRSIIHNDYRCRQSSFQRSSFHHQEVCGLKWSVCGCYLASGGNDNQLIVWDKASLKQPLSVYSDHIAAVKAISWSPHQRNLLASGGGTADRHIKVRNISKNELTSNIDTGSQVCNISWSKTRKALVSTHGYSQNQIVVWNYPTMSQESILRGHTYRVLYLATSPDGQNIVTGAGDETLRFWNVFPARKKSPNGDATLINDLFKIR